MEGCNSVLVFMGRACDLGPKDRTKFEAHARVECATSIKEPEKEHKITRPATRGKGSWWQKNSGKRCGAAAIGRFLFWLVSADAEIWLEPQYH